jgi:hypothetical protein
MHYNLTMLYYLIIFMFMFLNYFILILYSINLLKSFFEREDKHFFNQILSHEPINENRVTNCRIIS